MKANEKTLKLRQAIFDHWEAEKQNSQIHIKLLWLICKQIIALTPSRYTTSNWSSGHLINLIFNIHWLFSFWSTYSWEKHLELDFLHQSGVHVGSLWFRFHTGGWSESQNKELTAAKKLSELQNFVGLEFQVTLYHYTEQFGTMFLSKVSLSAGLTDFTTNR